MRRVSVAQLTDFFLYVKEVHSLIVDARAARPLAHSVLEAQRPASGHWVRRDAKPACAGDVRRQRAQAVAAVVEEARRIARRRPSRNCGPGGVATTATAAFKDPGTARHAVVGQHEVPIY